MSESATVLRVLVVEDHPVYRDALALALSSDEGVEVVGSCSTPEEAVAGIEQVAVDVVVADLEWRWDLYAGIKLIHRVLAAAPSTGVVVCSAHDDPESIRLALQAGAIGYLLKDETEAADVVQAVKAVGCGRPFYSRTIIRVVTDLVSEALQGITAVHPLGKLTPREREVLSLLADGFSNAEIADRLGIAEKTVKTHVSHILGKLDLESRYQVAGYLRRHRKGDPGSERRRSKT